MVLVVTAAEIAYDALPCLANGNPSIIVAAALLAPGMPSKIPEKLSPVVLAATTAIKKITPEYGSLTKYGISPYSATNPVVAPAAGTTPINKPYNTPVTNANISIYVLQFYLERYAQRRAITPLMRSVL